MRVAGVVCTGSLLAAVSALSRPQAGSSNAAVQHVLGHGSEQAKPSFKCDLPPPVAPSDDGFPSAKELFTSKEALLKQVERHSALVKVPSICYDDLGDFDKDERWKSFYDFHDALEKTFPTVHARMRKEIVNTFGLVYTIVGSDTGLKPIMLTAHQDVVPVADASTWTYPPFSAHFDGRWLWGRGASDDKNSMTALMSALESLLSYGTWTPTRTIILAFGFDEECSGRKGAGSIARYLERLYGNDSVAIVLDEGGMGLQLIDSTLYALPAVMEKGHIDIWFELHVNGGHSSTPYPHTGIGIISEIITRLEANPYKPKLIAGSPIHNHLICQARYSPDAQPKITKLIEKGDLDALAKELVTLDRATQFRIQTSQAVDIIVAGVKINAMPEIVKLGVNYRVAPHNSLGEVKKNIVKYVKPTVKKYGLTLKVAFEGEDESQYVDELEDLDTVEEGDNLVQPMYDVDYNGTLILRSTQGTLPAPVSPSSDAVWDLFSGTIQHSFGFEDGKVVPVGELMTGNTDTRHYLGLTRNVYRWTPTRQGHTVNAHTVDERIDMEAHMEALRFYYDLIRNFDASDV